MKINVTIKGIAPLLQNRFPEAEQFEDKTRKRAGMPEEMDVEKRLYKFPDGTIYQPAEHILGAMIKASTNFLIVGKRKKSYRELVESSIFIEPECIPHKIQKWVVDKRSVVNPATKGRQIRLRPRFDEWELDFKIITYEKQLPFEVIKQILDYAGTHIGIGDFRPRFGRFIVTKFELAEE